MNATCAENDTVKSSNATVNVYVTDIKIEKTANVTEGLVNDLVNFTIVVRNHGNNPATKVNITDVLDNSFEFELALFVLAEFFEGISKYGNTSDSI